MAADAIEKRTTGGRFAPGVSGNPNGARARAGDPDTIIREARPRIALKLVALALAGDIQAAEIVLRLGLHPAQPAQAAA